jgi:hypothetical protein
MPRVLWRASCEREREMKTHYYEEEMKKAGDVRKMMEHRGLRGQDSAELQDTRRNKEKKERNR